MKYIKYKRQRQKAKFPSGFTLIELLVVISIIGLLASIVTVNVNKARGKAIRTASLQFEAEVHHALGDQLICDYEFDNPGGSMLTTNDSSGNNNNGARRANYRCASTNRNNTPSGNGCALSFDTRYDYVQPNSPINNDPITISLWHRYDGASGEGINVLLCHEGIGNRIHLLINNSSKEIGFYNSGWHSSGYALTMGKWYYLVLVKNGTNSKLYINGKLEQDSNSSFKNSDDPLTLIGNYGGHSGAAIGLIDNVRIYSEAMPSAQIKQLYTQGLKKHKLAER